MSRLAFKMDHGYPAVTDSERGKPVHNEFTMATLHGKPDWDAWWTRL